MTDAGRSTPPEGRAAPLPHHHIAITDFEQLVLAFRGWDADFHQLSRGAFCGDLDVVQLGCVEVVRVVSNRVMQARGCSPPDAYGFSLVTRANEAATWRGRRLKSGQLNLNRPAGVIDHLSSARYESLLIRVDAGELRKHHELLYGVGLDDRLGQADAFTVRPTVFTGLEQLVQDLIPSGPNPATPHVALTPGQAARLCLDRLLRALTSAAPIAERAAAPPNRRSLVRRVEEFMRENLKALLAVEDLCAEVGVCERTLRYAFGGAYGQGPMAFFKTLKLHAVRRELKQGRAAGATVHEVARRWGFGHTGNFAADYRRLFGELPSETSARQAMSAALARVDQKS